MSRPRFFCENCGAEVPRDAKNCPRCGRFFASVKCPACGFTGEEGLFSGGCPVCGYSAFPRKDGGGPFPAQTPRKRETGALPVWVYILTLLALLAVAGVLFFRMQ